MSGPDSRLARSEVVGRRVSVGTSMRGDFTYTVVECDRATGDRRGEKRLRSRLREGFVADGRKAIAECRIRDLSKRGARLQLEKDRPLPKTFLLTEAGTRRCFRAELIWQVGRDAGVRLKPLEQLA